MKRILSILSAVDKMKYILKNLNKLDSIGELYSDEDLSNVFDIDAIDYGKQYNIFVKDNVKPSDDIKAIKFTTDGEATIEMTAEISGEIEHEAYLEYSMDGSTWTTWDLSALTIHENDALYIRGKNPDGLSTYDLDSDDETHIYYSFGATGDNLYCSGDLKYLIDYEKDVDELPHDSFVNLFFNCKTLVTAPDLTMSIIGEDACFSMFRGCTALTKSPELPATTMGDYCYSFMFYGCTSLVEAPVLPAKTLAEGCYGYMFYGCSKLSKMTCLYESADLFDYTKTWLNRAPRSGVFYASKDRQWLDQYGASAVPTGWTIVDIQ